MKLHSVKKIAAISIVFLSSTFLYGQTNGTTFHQKIRPIENSKILEYGKQYPEIEVSKIIDPVSLKSFSLIIKIKDINEEYCYELYNKDDLVINITNTVGQIVYESK